MKTLTLDGLAYELAALTVKYGINLTGWPMEGHAVIALEIQDGSPLLTESADASQVAGPLAVDVAQGACIIFADLQERQVLVRQVKDSTVPPHIE